MEENLKKYFTEAYQAMLLEQDFTFDEVGAAKDFADTDDRVDDYETDLDVIDPEAYSDEDLEDDYQDHVILKCPQCSTKNSPTLIFKAKEDVIIGEDEDELANVGESCPKCGQTRGFKVVGKVVENSELPEEESDELEDTDLEKVDDMEVEDDPTKIDDDIDFDESEIDEDDFNISELEGIDDEDADSDEDEEESEDNKEEEDSEEDEKKSKKKNESLQEATCESDKESVEEKFIPKAKLKEEDEVIEEEPIIEESKECVECDKSEQVVESAEEDELPADAIGVVKSNESLGEDFRTASFDTDTEHVDLSVEPNGHVQFNSEPINEVGTESIAPLDDTDMAELDTNGVDDSMLGDDMGLGDDLGLEGEAPVDDLGGDLGGDLGAEEPLEGEELVAEEPAEGEESEEDLDFDGLANESFDALANKFVKAVNESFGDYTTTSVKELADHLVVNGTMKTSVGSRDISFELTSPVSDKAGRIIFEGVCKGMPRNSEITVNFDYKNKALYPTTLKYKVPTRTINESLHKIELTYKTGVIKL